MSSFFYIAAFAADFSASHNDKLLNLLASLGADITSQESFSNTNNSGSKYLVSTENSLSDLRSQCNAFAHANNIDISVQQTSQTQPQPHKRKMVFFDMDSTVIQQEVIVELAKAANIGDKVAEITESAMRGEIDFNESFAQRVALLKGLSTDVLDGIAHNLTLSDGAEHLLKRLHEQGYYTVILSGGFNYFARYLQQKLGFHEVHANTLNIRDGVVTGEVTLPIVDGARKALLLEQIAQQQGIARDDVVAIGDGANDLAMMSVANIGVAFKAKPLVQEQAEHALNHVGLDGLLHILNEEY